MAAHILTALGPLSKRENWNGNLPEQTLTGLSYARFGDQLTGEEWSILRAILSCPDRDAAYSAYMAFYFRLPNYHQAGGPYYRLYDEWTHYNQPETVEAWLSAKYGGGK